jgi:hypothetical protein
MYLTHGFSSRLLKFWGGVLNYKPIKQRYQLMIFVVAWIACYEILSRVLFENLKNEIYSIDADSIGVPMMENLFLGFSIGSLCGIGLLIPKTRYMGIVSILVIGLGVLLALLGVVYWFFPNHYIASFGHLLPFGACIYMLFSAWVSRRHSLEKHA